MRNLGTRVAARGMDRLPNAVDYDRDDASDP
jgi:hypothetical protein